MKVFGYSGCDTCRKATKFLEKQGVDYESVPIVEQPPTKTELKRMLGFVGGEIKKLFNTSGQVYRELKLGEKLPSMSEEEALTLLAKNGKLVKRPFLLAKDWGAVGFKEADWKKRLG